MDTNQTNGVPVAIEYRNGQERVDGRSLHEALEVGRDFTNWIKGRIEEYNFIHGEDYQLSEGLSSPDPANSKSRAQKTAEYTLTLDMAKELALVENNERGRAIRKYFIAVEKRAREAAMQTGKTAGLPEGDAVFELIGIIRSQAAAIENLAKETPASRRSGAVAAPAILAGKSDAVGEWINTTQLAALYGKTRATCLSHARAMGWAMRVSRLETGSLTYEFLLASLPEKIQAAWKEQKEATVPIM